MLVIFSLVLAFVAASSSSSSSLSSSSLASGVSEHKIVVVDATSVTGGTQEAAGEGDLEYWSGELLTADGSDKAGTTVGSCTWTLFDGSYESGTYTCSWTWTFGSAGSVSVAGTWFDALGYGEGTVNQYAIVGGTGRFSGARGVCAEKLVLEGYGLPDGNPDELEVYQYVCSITERSSDSVSESDFSSEFSSSSSSSGSS